MAVMLAGMNVLHAEARRFLQGDRQAVRAADEPD